MRDGGQRGRFSAIEARRRTFRAIAAIAAIPGRAVSNGTLQQPGEAVREIEFLIALFCLYGAVGLANEKARAHCASASGSDHHRDLPGRREKDGENLPIGIV